MGQQSGGGLSGEGPGGRRGWGYLPAGPAPYWGREK